MQYVEFKLSQCRHTMPTATPRGLYCQSKLTGMKRTILTTILLSRFSRPYVAKLPNRSMEHPRTQHLCLVPSARFTDALCLRFGGSVTPHLPSAAPVGRALPAPLVLFGFQGSARPFRISAPNLAPMPRDPSSGQPQESQIPHKARSAIGQWAQQSCGTRGPGCSVV